MTYSFGSIGVNIKSIRQVNDFYATEPSAVKELLKVERFSHKVLEPCVGKGHIAITLEKSGYNVFGTDIVYRGYKKFHKKDFLKRTKIIKRDIITNPPL